VNSFPNFSILSLDFCISVYLMGLEIGSSGRVPTLQAQSSEFKPQSHKKKEVSGFHKAEPTMQDPWRIDIIKDDFIGRVLP
jgi:hypothetical protein